MVFNNKFVRMGWFRFKLKLFLYEVFEMFGEFEDIMDEYEV